MREPLCFSLPGGVRMAKDALANLPEPSHESTGGFELHDFGRRIDTGLLTRGGHGVHAVPRERVPPQRSDELPVSGQFSWGNLPHLPRQPVKLLVVCTGRVSHPKYRFSGQVGYCKLPQILIQSVALQGVNKPIMCLCCRWGKLSQLPRPLVAVSERCGLP